VKVEGNKGHLVFFSHTTFVDGGGGGVLLCNPNSSIPIYHVLNHGLRDIVIN